MAEGNLWQREPALVIGTVVTAAVVVFAKYRGVDTATVVAQAVALYASFVAVRSRVTPYVEGAIKEYERLRGGSAPVADGGDTYNPDSGL